MKKHIVHKLYWNYEKEEKWLNEMASKGFNFIDFTWARYLFEKSTPGEYIYRIELLPNPVSHPESQAYIEFMESVGVEYMGKWMRWVYFRKKASEGRFEIFSDLDSKIRHYRGVRSLFVTLGGLNLIAVIINVFNGVTASSEFSRRLLAGISPVLLLNGLIVIVFTGFVIGYNRKIERLKKEKLLRE